MQLFRADGVLDLTQVKGKKLIFAGLGSLGSLTLASLAYPWRQLVLADPDTLEPENLERHLFNGVRYIGRSKVDVAKDWLVEAGLDPSTVIVHAGQVQEVLADHSDADLVLVNIDRRRYSEDVNDWCHRHDIPALYGRVYPKGVGGEVMVISQPQKACYLCGAAFMGIESGEVERTPNYGVETPVAVEKEVATKAIPSLRASADSVASTASMLALELLFQEEVPPNQVLCMAFSSWQPTLVIQTREQAEQIRAYALALAKCGVQPNLDIREEDGRKILLLRHGKMTFRLQQWGRCPLHATAWTDE